MTTCQLWFKYGKIIYDKIFHPETSKVSASNRKSLLVLPASYTEKHYSLGEIALASFALESDWFLHQLTPKHKILSSVYIFLL